MKIALSEIYQAIKEQADYVNLNNSIHSLEFAKGIIELEENEYMEYKVGDKVKIREDLNIYETYNGTCAVVGMLKYGGEIAVITKQRSINQYYLGIDGGEYFWTPEMFDQNYKPESEVTDDEQ